MVLFNQLFGRDVVDGAAAAAFLDAGVDGLLRGISLMRIGRLCSVKQLDGRGEEKYDDGTVDGKNLYFPRKFPVLCGRLAFDDGWRAEDADEWVRIVRMRKLGFSTSGGSFSGMRA